MKADPIILFLRSLSTDAFSTSAVEWNVMPKFVVLFHRVKPGSGRADHYDLMIERPAKNGTDETRADRDESSLMTWELSRTLAVGVLEARRLPNHRVFYLDFEGPISNDRGHVQRVQAGQAKWSQFDEQEMRAELSFGAEHWSAHFVPCGNGVYRLTISNADGLDSSPC